MPVDFEASCPAFANAPWSRVASATLLRAGRSVADAADVLRAALLCLLAVLALVAFSVQAVDTDRIVRSAQKYGPTGVANAKALQQMMASLAGKDDAARIKAVNDFFNQRDRKSTRLNSSHPVTSRMPSSA